MNFSKYIWVIVPAAMIFGLLSQIDSIDGSVIPNWWSTVVVVAAFGLGGYLLYQGKNNSLTKFTGVAAAILIVVAMFNIAFGSRWVSDPAAQTAFAIMNDASRNVTAGDPEYMGYADNVGRMVRGTHPKTGELLHSSDCRPSQPTQVQVMDKDGNSKTETMMLPVPHRGFDYITDGICVSPTDGMTKMVPWDTKFSPVIPDLNPLQSPAELAAEVAEEEAEHRRRIEILQAKNPAPPPFNAAAQPITKVVRACGNGVWEEVNIPSDHTIHLPWNTAAATYEWRDSASGLWITRPLGNVDKVRFCAKHKNYAGDTMLITFTRS